MAINERRGTTGMPLISMDVVMTDFNAFLKTFFAKLSDPKQAKAIAKIGLDLLYLVIRKNPVLTGRSRAAWYPGFNALVSALGARTTPQTPKSRDEAAGYAKGSYALQLAGLHKSVVLTNAVEYIEALEYGWSTKAPYGMVRVSIMIIMRQLPSYIESELVQLWNAAGARHFSHWNQSPGGPAKFFRGPTFPGQPSLTATATP